MRRVEAINKRTDYSLVLLLYCFLIFSFFCIFYRRRLTFADMFLLLLEVVRDIPKFPTLVIAPLPFLLAVDCLPVRLMVCI